MVVNQSPMDSHSRLFPLCLLVFAMSFVTSLLNSVSFPVSLVEFRTVIASSLT